MSTPQANTKVERAVEAIEDLALAVAESVQVGGGAPAFKRVQESREELRDALREYIQPVLRAVR